MNNKLSEIHLRRGRLLERIASQRASLSRDVVPLSAALERGDHILDSARSAVEYVKQHPGVVSLAVAGLFLVNRARFWRWAKRGFVAWNTFRTLKNRLSVFGFGA